MCRSFKDIIIDSLGWLVLQKPLLCYISCNGARFILLLYCLLFQ